MGFASGFQVGASAVERGLKMREEDALKRSLAQEAGRYGVTEGAYGPGLQENIQQLQGLREQDPAQAAAYDQAIGELTRRQGLTAPDYSVASGPTNFATRQEARQAAAPMRAEALAGVYRQYGDVAQADALETRAFDQQRALAAEQRAVAGEARAQQTFAGGETERGLRINEATRIAAEQEKETNLNSFISENPNADFGAITAQAKTLGMSSAQQFKIASNLTGIKEQAFKDSQMRIRDLVKNQGLDGLLKAHKESQDLDPGSHFEVIRGKGGAVSLNRVNTATGEIIQPNVFSGNEAETTAYLNRAAMDPATIIDFTMNLAKNKSAIEAQGAATEASRAATGLRNQQMQMLRTQAAGNAEAQDVRARYEALTPDEQVGPTGQGLIRQFNMANAKAGTPIPLGAAPRAERPALSPADVTARAKALYEARTPSLNNPKKPMTMTEAISFVEGGMQNPVAARLDAALGGGGDPFASPAAGGGAPQQTRGLTQPAAAPAPARNAPAEPNPYVDARGRPLAAAPAGAPSIASSAIPAAASAVEGAVGTQAAATRYLQAKIARNEPLTATDRARAVQLGLVRQ